jgi:XTP/dITP diphosphohydrolase
MSVPAIERIVLASGNPGKIREISRLFADLHIEVIAQMDLGIDSPEETGETFVANALLKARHAALLSGLPAMADDSGIAVDALDGRPGVRSARYAGDGASDEENLDKLLEDMREVGESQRAAAFHCAAVLVFPDDTHEPLIAEGIWRGTLLKERRGDGGFGYDPIFLDDSIGKTGAELSREEKNTVSHRGKAFRQLRNLLHESR